MHSQYKYESTYFCMKKRLIPGYVQHMKMNEKRNIHTKYEKIFVQLKQESNKS